MFSKFKYLQSWFSKKEVLFLSALSLFLVLSRIPSLFEAWWYGDENIYMAVGQALASGRWLYLEAWDNKPPFIYLVYAFSYTLFGNLLWPLRLFNVFLALVEILTFFLITRKVFGFSSQIVLWSTGILTLFLAVGLEGTIFNAENIFVPLIWLGFLLNSWQLSKHLQAEKISWIWLSIGSLAWSLAAFTKVQAILEVGMLGLIMIIIFWKHYFESHKISLGWWQDTFFWKFFGLIGLFISVPYILLFVTYGLVGEMHTLFFSLLGFGSDYIESGKDPILFGFSLSFISGVVLRGVCLLTVLTWSSILFFKGQLSQNWFVILNWLAIGIFASLLSERNYPHYLLQVLPILILAGMASFDFLTNQAINIIHRISHGVVVVLLMQTFLTTFTGGNFVWNYFSPVHYFYGFTQVLIGGQSLSEWQNGYDYGMVSNQSVLAHKIQNLTSYNDKIFIVANRPELYFLSNRLNGHRFIADYHFSLAEVGEVYTVLVENDVKLIIIDSRSDKLASFIEQMRGQYVLEGVYEENYSIWLKI